MIDRAGGALGFLRRRWLLVVVTVAVASGVGWLLQSRGPEQYTATGTLQVNRVALQRSPELGTQDTFLAALQSADFVERMAAAGDMSADVRGGRINAFAVGDTGRISVTFTTPSEADAELLAPLLAPQAAEHYLETNADVIERQRRLVANSAGAAAEIEPLVKDATGAERVEGRFMLWQIDNTAAVHRSQLEDMEGVYTALADSSVAPALPRADLKTLLGAAMLGLVAGVAVAFVADRLGMASARL